MYIKYLVIFILLVSCSAQKSKNRTESNSDYVFTTFKWKKLVIEELKKNPQFNAKQNKLSENIEFINSIDNSYLEKKFLYSGFKNLKLKDRNNFFLINYFYQGDGHYEYTYVFQKTNRCRSYLITNDGFDQKLNVNRVNCDQKLNSFNFLMNSQNNRFTPVKGLLILWSCVDGKNQVKVFSDLTIDQEDLVENIFY